MPNTRMAALLSLSSDHDVEPPVGAATQQHFQLAGPSIPAAAGRCRLKQRHLIVEFDVANSWNGCREIESFSVEPAQHLIHRMVGLMRVLVLVHVPGLL